MTDTPNPALALLYYTVRFHIAVILATVAGAAVAYAVTLSPNVAIEVGGVVGLLAGFCGLLPPIWALYR